MRSTFKFFIYCVSVSLLIPVQLINNALQWAANKTSNF